MISTGLDLLPVGGKYSAILLCNSSENSGTFNPSNSIDFAIIEPEPPDSVMIPTLRPLGNILLI